ncbi:hypothetical protein D3C85_1097560 [compost metagenome]
MVVDIAHFAGLAAAGGGEGVIVGCGLSQLAAVGVIDQRALAVDHVKKGVVAVEVLVEQAVQHIVFMQVERPGDEPQITVVA